MKRFKNILYFADGETAPSPALHRALRLAETNGARLTLIDVLEPLDLPNDIAERLGRDLREMLSDQRQQTLGALPVLHRHVGVHLDAVGAAVDHGPRMGR